MTTETKPTTEATDEENAAFSAGYVTSQPVFQPKDVTSQPKAVSLREAKAQAAMQTTNLGIQYVVVKNPYLGGYWVLTASSARANGLKPVG